MVPVEILRELYQQQGMTAAEVGEVSGPSRMTILRSTHELVSPSGPAAPYRWLAREKLS